VAGQFNRFLGAVVRESRVAAGFTAVSDFFFHTGILYHAVQQARSRHQDVVALFLAEMEGCLRL
jgi:hypothetical protein